MRAHWRQLGVPQRVSESACCAGSQHQVSDDLNAPATGTLPHFHSLGVTAGHDAWCGFIDADAFIVDVPRTAATNAYYDDRHYLLRFVGTWSHPIGGPYADAQDTTLSVTRIAEDFVTFTFVGTIIQPCFSRAYNRGMVAITVDGEERAIIDLYAPGVERGYCPYYLLNAGVHTIHIANTGQKHPNSSDYFIDIDYIWVAQQ